MRILSGLLIFLILSSHGVRAEDSPPLDHFNLLRYRDLRGEVRSVETPSDWQQRRSAIIAAMREIMGLLPSEEKRCALEIEVKEEVDGGDHVRRLITYQAEPGSRVPAYLLIPKKLLESGAAPAAAALCLHPTNDLGHKVVVGLGNAANRAYALELTRRGFVTIAPAYPLLANYQPDLKTLGYVSGTMKAIWDNIRAVDLLESLPFVRRGGVAAIGHSLGGHNALYTAVFEPRIKVVVTSCGFDSYRDYFAGNPNRWEPGKGWTQERYMPRLADYRGRLQELPFDFPEVIAALAPRAVFVSAPKEDSNFQWRSVDRVTTAAAAIFRLYGASGQLVVEHPESAHDFPDAVRDQAYQFIEQQLSPGA